jgi:hypothetical protein
VQAHAVGSRWQASSPTKLEPALLPLDAKTRLYLPVKAWRKQPPTQPDIVLAGGLQPYTVPWSRPASVELVGPDEGLPSNAVLYWNGQLNFKGASLELGTTLENVHGAFASEGKYENQRLTEMMGTVWLERGTVAKQPLSAAKANYRLREVPTVIQATSTPITVPIIEVRDMTADLFGGKLGGEARIRIDNQPRFRVWLTASGVQLEEMARHHRLGSGELKGALQGTLLLENPPDPKTGQQTIIGTGQLDVPEGRLYNLPVLLELVKVLKGQTPDGVAFEEAHAVFDLKGDQITVRQLDLLGTAVSLGGSGTLDMTGQDVNFEFYTIWSQTLRRWLMTPFGEVTGLMSGGLFKIELKRIDGVLTPKAHMLPAITDPVRDVAERLRNRFGPPDVQSRRQTSPRR